MPNFKETVMFKRGLMGEQIVDELIREKGDYIPYMPVFEGGHPFDRILASADKRRLQILEIKTISARKYYPDTGISIVHYEDYQHIQRTYSLDVFIAFVDAVLKKIYGNTLKQLSKTTDIIHRGKLIKYPLIQDNFSAVGGKIIYFPLINMVDIYELSDEQCKEIERYANYGYKKDMSYKSGYSNWLKSK